MTLTNLSVKDLGDIVEASFQSEGCRVVVKIQDNTLREYDISTNKTAHTFYELVESYLKQNLK